MPEAYFYNDSVSEEVIRTRSLEYLKELRFEQAPNGRGSFSLIAGIITRVNGKTDRNAGSRTLGAPVTPQTENLSVPILGTQDTMTLGEITNVLDSLYAELARRADA